MVVNLCLPHFKTTIQCDKLCADGYDVTNLLSADPAVRRRGFKLEYFLRPPVQVTLQFGFQVEVCRVDVELWPWGMDRGQACKRLEISTSSDPPLPHNHSLEQGQTQDQQGQEKGQQWDQAKAQFKGHQWSLQAQQYSLQGQEKSQQWTQRGQTHSHTDTSQGAFHLVGRCELTEETHVSFSHPCFRPRPPFPSLPPAPREGCRQEELWSRGPLSLGSVKQLRVTVPYGAGASAMGLKALAVWGLPSRCCPPDEVERVRITHENANLRPVPRLSHLASAQPSPVNQPPALSQTTTATSLLQVPEEFLDPLTQEVMLLPMLLPSGVSVDSSTLEEYQRREATWGRVPNDPFTGVPFVSESQALPNPHLKSRIDRFLLQTGLEVREGAVGRQGHGESPHPSRLIPPQRTGESRDSAVTTAAAVESANHQGALSRNSGTRTQTTQKGAESVITQRSQLTQYRGTGAFNNRAKNGNGKDRCAGKVRPKEGAVDRVSSQEGGPDLGTRRKRELEVWATLIRSKGKGEPTGPKAASASAGHSKELLPDLKRPRTDANPTISSATVPSSSSHEQRLSASLDYEQRLSASLDQEQRLSASLDQALLSALQGRPSFTSYPSQTPQLQHKHTDTPADTPTAFPISLFPPLLSPLPFLSLPGENRCGSCSCSLSVYSTSPSAYRLPCGHFLCRPCLHRKSRPLVTTAMPNHILCPTCHSPAASSDITHVHH
ncbi:RING finger protein 37-like isoform X1 [Salvelinus fontinalis]|uniref:RING finger protein 37-like isoform X1 n=1 Tax=Salvelinus fontinalis TaxID=8038 RepID=UPI002485705C|nr:RING finger protein 37-like isoform X1 [Salvelinus fontinalis]XP_055743689.1 RING finger protein 37-like isoform X1 [Salvelinus fontinalis]